MEQHPTSFGWLAKASRCERSNLMSLTVEFGRGLDWRSWDPSIFGELYGNALVGGYDRRQLGIHYAPPRLAAGMMDNMQVELIPPEARPFTTTT